MNPHSLHFANLSHSLAHRLGFRLVLAGLGGLLMLAVQGCTTANMPQPKYPIYMQDKPAAPTSTLPPAPVEAAPPPVTTPSPSGSVQSSELAPLTPPPPPPPPAETLHPSTPVAAAPSRPKPSAVPPAPAEPAGAAYVYVMQPKDTLFGVSRRFNVNIHQIYALNDLSADSPIRVGQKILLPAFASDKGAEEHANGPGPVKVKASLAAATPAVSPGKLAVTAPPPPPVVKPSTTTTTTTTTTVTKPTVAPPVTQAATQPSKPVVAKPVAPPPGFPANAQLAQMGKGKFIWPVKGHVLVPFGQLAPNVRNDGINIAAGSGTEVKAAADGVVVYEGDQVKELGNTIYIKHDNGWYTGYSHLKTMKVQNNEHVTKGQVIGTVGETGTIDKPQLHFEIRYTPSTDIARPIDPTIVLP
ncbi:MAG: M23 family metallopeptidase [Asticcacaulis sp.]|uniref:peptidoglycan DD-metalloendopeptidase family protein n=1 Tax=Asticcacaulis sp. TaxID=1872648 RepID=UPI0039E307E8